jgi:hypothetical protein
MVVVRLGLDFNLSRWGSANEVRRCVRVVTVVRRRVVMWGAELEVAGYQNQAQRRWAVAMCPNQRRAMVSHAAVPWRVPCEP